MENIIKIINTENLKHNINWLKSQQKNICAVVKADAYGHGIENIVPHIDLQTKFYAVNTIREAKKVRKFSEKPILVLCGFEKKDLNFVLQNNVHLAIFCKKQLESIINYARKHAKNIYIHLKINTGMNRLGFKQEELPEVQNMLNNQCFVKLCGIFTHFGGGNEERNLAQEKEFLKCQQMFPNILFHCKSSSYSLQKSKKNEMARCGLMLYGYGNKCLKPVLEIKAKIIFVGFAKKNDYVGYGINFRAKENIKYAVLAIGYSDGLPRNYAKNGYVLINGKKAKICGNICMNMTIVNTNHIEVRENDYATILSEKLNADIIAKKCSTICYEILTNFSKMSSTCFFCNTNQKNDIQ